MLETGEQPQAAVSTELLEQLQNDIKALQKAGKPAIAPIATEGTTAEAIHQLVTELRKKPDSEKFGLNKYVNIADIDPDDFMEIPRVFFAHKVGYVIVDDIRKGHRVQTPFGNVIIFGYDSTTRVQHGREYDLHNICIYQCQSKKEAKWLEESSFYGIYIFDRAKAAITSTAKKAAHLARHMAVLREMGQYRLVESMKSNELPVMENLQDMRIALANHHADKDVERESTEGRSRTEKMLEDSLEAKKEVA